MLCRIIDQGGNKGTMEIALDPERAVQQGKSFYGG